MRIDSINLSEGGKVTNLTLASGADFPSSANLGELFYLTTGTPGVYFHNGTTWVHVSSGADVSSFISLIGDATGSGAGDVTVTLANSGATAGSYGAATKTLTISVDAKGRITSVAAVDVAVDASQVTSGTFADARLPTAPHTASGSFLKVEIDSHGRVVGTTPVVASDITSLVGSSLSEYVSKSDAAVQPAPKLSVGGVNVETKRGQTTGAAFTVHSSYSSTGISSIGYCNTVTSANVGGNIQLGRSTSSSLGVATAVAGSGIQLGALHFTGYKDASYGYASGAVISAYSASAWQGGNGTAPSYLVFSTSTGNERAWEEQWTEQMRIASTGAVTFGSATSAPAAGYILKSNGNASPSWQLNSFASLSGIPTSLAGYGITDAYTKSAIDSALANKANASTTLAGYGITDAYTKSAIDSALANKANASTTLAGYGITDAYTKSAIDSALANKANASTTLAGYGITDGASLTQLATKADKATTLAGYGITDAATATTVAGKADKATTLAGYGITDAHPLHGSTSLDLAAQNMTVSGSILPTVSSTQDLGSSTMRWRKIFVDEAMLSVNTLYLGDTPVMGTSQNVVNIKADPNQSILIKTTALGTTGMTSEAGVNINTTGMNADVVVQASGTGSKVRFTATDNVEFTGAQIMFNGPVTANGAAITGNLTVSGNLTVQGSNTVINSTTVTTKDNIIVVNNGETGSGVTSVLGGLQIDRGDLTDYQFVFDETDDLFKVGIVGSLYAVATRNYVDNAVALKADKGTTLASYGITDAYTKSATDTALAAKANVATTLTGYGIIDAQPFDADLAAIAGLAGTSGLLKKTAANTWKLDTSAYLTGNQTITFTGDATGSGTTSVALTLANSGVTAGWFGPNTDLGTAGKTAFVQVDAKGRIVGGGNVDATVYWTNILNKPTTVAGYGITDAVSSSTLSGYVSKTGAQTMDGPLAIGNPQSAATTGSQLHLVGTGTTTGNNYGIVSTVTHRPTASGSFTNFYSQPDIAAAAVVGGLYHFRALTPTTGAGYTAVQQMGFIADAGLTDVATSNYGFYTTMNAGTKTNYAIFSYGTAKSLHAGKFLFGTNTIVGSDTQLDTGAVNIRCSSGDTSSSGDLQLVRYSPDTTGNKIKFNKSYSATMGTATQLATGVVIGELDFAVPNGSGVTGSVWSDSAKIVAVSSATHTTSALATDLVFYTASALAPVERMRIASSGAVSIGGNLSANNITCGSIIAASPVTFSSGATVLGVTVLSTLHVGAAGAETSVVSTVASTAATTVDTFATASYRAAKYTIVITQGIAYQMTNVNVLHDGTNAYVTEYGTMLAGSSTDLGTFDASISSGTLSLKVTMASAISATLKIVADLIKV